MNAQVTQTIEALIGPDALAAVQAKKIQDWDDPDTPGLRFKATLPTEEKVWFLITLQPYGNFHVVVSDRDTMATIERREYVHASELSAIVAGFAEEA